LSFSDIDIMASLIFSVLFLLLAAAQSTELSVPVIERHLFKQFGGINGFFLQRTPFHHREVQEADCPGTPYLYWKIVDESGNHVSTKCL
jgi:hypothetical protein